MVLFQLSSDLRLLKDLKRIRAKHLYLADNPLTKKPQYPECLKPLQANFQYVVGDALIDLCMNFIWYFFAGWHAV